VEETGGKRRRGQRWRQILQTVYSDIDYYLQFDSFVPVDNVTRYSERLKANDVHIAAFRSDVQPLALKRQVTVTNSAHHATTISTYCGPVLISRNTGLARPSVCLSVPYGLLTRN